jgi:hypothetical protein
MKAAGRQGALMLKRRRKACDVAAIEGQPQQQRKTRGTGQG